MLNLKDVIGVQSSPISQNILEGVLGDNIRDARAFKNYELMLDNVSNGTFKPPSILMASGKGDFAPRATQGQHPFYSMLMLGRDGYTNTWYTSYNKDESYGINYYAGNTLFKGLSITPSTGRVKVRSLETRNGNQPRLSGFVQFLMGYNTESSSNDQGNYRHNIRTRHSPIESNQNAIDIFLWDVVADSKLDAGSRRTLSLYGNGNVELVSGTSIYGALQVPITTTQERETEQDNLAVENKGVLYFNKPSNRFRYSENGELFKFLGEGSGGAIETCSLSMVAPYRKLEPDEAMGVMLYTHKAITIKSLLLSTYESNMLFGIAIYARSTSSPDYYRVYYNDYNIGVGGGQFKVVEVILNAPVNINEKTNYIIFIYNKNSDVLLTPRFACSVNVAASLYDFVTNIDDNANATQFTSTSFNVPDSINLENLTAGTIVPYIAIGAE